VWPGYSSSTTESLNVFSGGGVANDTLVADKEEDDIVTYHRWWHAVCLIRARSPVEKEQRGQASSCKTRVFQRELEQAKALVNVGFLYARSDASRNPKYHSKTSHQ
jgi:hypothetical protein